MNAPNPRRIIPRLALAIVACLVLFSAGTALEKLLADESTQAHAFVAEGQRDLANGDRAHAALAFERARLLAPRAELVRASIAAVDVKDAESPLSHALRMVTAREWFAVAIAAGWTSGLALAFVVARWPRRRAQRVALVGAAVLAVAVAAIVHSNATSPAIVMASNARLLVAPYATAAVDQPIAAGSMVVVGSRYDDYVHVEDADGAQGWVPRRDIEPISGG